MDAEAVVKRDLLVDDIGALREGFVPNERVGRRGLRRAHQHRAERQDRQEGERARTVGD